VVCALVLLAAAAESARAQGTDQAAAFVRGLVEAINSRSPDRRKALLHPKSVSCAGVESGSFYEEIVTRQARRGVPANYTWKMTQVPPQQPPMFEDKFDYPIRPTHLLQLDFETGPSRSTTMVLQLVYETNQWREVIGCPKPETIAAARAARQARAKRAERVRTLVAGTSPRLRDTVVKLFKEGRRVEAFKHYSSVSGEDLATAREVVELLAGQGR
jgi:hypothetical protein